MTSGVTVAIDRGGTFTDVLAVIPSQPDYVFKILSEDPANYKDANIEAIRRVLEKITKKPIPKDSLLDTTPISSIRLGTTVATNALLERKGARCALLTTAGFKDILRIGDQTRPDLFAMNIVKPDMLYEEVVEIKERVTMSGYSEDPEQTDVSQLPELYPENHIYGNTGEVFRVIQPLDVSDTESKLRILKQKNIESLGICLVHGYNFTEHEKAVKAIAEKLGFQFVVASHELMPTIKAIPRAQSVVVDAYLTPIIKRYIASFRSGFVPGFDQTTRVEFMQSDGGLVPWTEFSGLKALLSGPAGGVVGEAQTCYDQQDGTPIIGFDMGGTSTDVSRYDGHYDYVLHSITAGVEIAVPQLDINTVAAGGGSVLAYENGVFKVGPESASAHPGPACYRKGGPLTITDANLFLGKIMPEFFPAIFGPDENQPLDYEIVEQKFRLLTEVINKENPGTVKTSQEVALGFLKVANHAMAKPIRALTEARGFNVAQHNLASFGGAGGQNCVDVASVLQMKRVVIHRYSSILSAYGIGLADIVKESMSPCNEVYSAEARSRLLGLCAEKEQELVDQMMAQDVSRDTIKTEYYFHMGYRGSETKLMIRYDPESDFGDTFRETHLREFSFTDPTRNVLVHDIRVRVTGSTGKLSERSLYRDLEEIKPRPVADGKHVKVQPIWFSALGTERGQQYRARVYRLETLDAGEVVAGPAVLLDSTQTIVVNPGWQARILPRHVVVDFLVDPVPRWESTSEAQETAMAMTESVSSISAMAMTESVSSISESEADPSAESASDSDSGSASLSLSGSESASMDPKRLPSPPSGSAERVVDPVLLAVFQNRFMAIAEAMGMTLQKIAVSANIKERLDFSCALFDADGNLTANAPHVPVHLGSMSHCIKYAKKYWSHDLHPGDVLASNHPCAGGTHLPDITLISPVFISGQLRFFTASRAHHAEIGGSAPGSCAADATELYQEGTQFRHWKIVSSGLFDYEGVERHFVRDPARYPGCSGTRNLADNLSDLKAQIAANQKGVNLLSDLFSEYGTDTVLFYMSSVKTTAERAVRTFLSKTARLSAGKLPLQAREILDDGSVLQVSIDIDEATGSAVYDFAGTSDEAFSPCNAPLAITHACVIYSLRLMLGQDIPLNEGCLAPVSIVVPPGCILNPSEEAAVSAANSITAQRLNDTILKAFGLCAASTGSNNTITFGLGGIDPVTGKMKPGFAMVETIGGGSGASLGHHGWSGVQCHMTNTRITDPEILEKRYPVLLREFSVREQSGGKGRWNGGDGLIRLYEFDEDLTITLRSQRRVNCPYGLYGGGPGAMGENKLGRRRDDGSVRWIHLPGFAQFKVRRGEMICIATPGGGGFGKQELEAGMEEDLYGDAAEMKIVGVSEYSCYSSQVPLAGGSLAMRTALANASQ